MRIGNRKLGRQAFPNSYGARRGGKGRLIMAMMIAGFALLSYCKSATYNPVTGEKQYLSLTPSQEIAMGLQAVPQMAAQHGGYHPDQRLQDFLDEVCQKIIDNSQAKQTDWSFECHLLQDANTVNAFALPGGQMFITYALFKRLETEGQLAGVMSHEIGHVVARHSAQRMAKAQLTQGIIGAVGVATESAGVAGAAQMIGQMVNMKYGREDELQSDQLGVRFMTSAGYDPRSLMAVMKILAEANGGKKMPEFFSTHPNPANRIERIKEAIIQEFPEGLPQGLTP
ncbi:MAG: M48 family metalloprotease [Kangiellaceae bacterium]|nr:M48 family metalloprotease [Kangiellaceae bacterium]